MPIIEVACSTPAPSGVLATLARVAAAAIGVPPTKAWVIWRELGEAELFIAGRGEQPWAAAFVTCRRSHSRTGVAALVDAVRAELGRALELDKERVFAQVRRVDDEEVWEIKDMEDQTTKLAHTVTPIAWVHNARTALDDDFWGGIESVIELDAAYPDDAFEGIEAFSHVMVIYWFHLLSGEVHVGARHPRGREDWPKIGIFAQRAKRRPNLIGLSCCRVLGREGRRLRVLDLDAVDGTPVLDIKPHIAQFGPQLDQGANGTTQPGWIDELMADYWAVSED